MKQLTLIFLFFAVDLQCQNDSLFNVADYFIDEESDEGNDAIIELLESLHNSPVDINNSSPEELLVIPFMDINSARNIIAFREQNGRFFSKSELYMINGLDKSIVKLMLPFVTTLQKEMIPDVRNSVLDFNLRNRISSDIQNKMGFITNSYKGNKLKSYTRLRTGYANTNLNLLIEKDPGEESFTDFYSFSLLSDDLIPASTVIAGDYLVEFGQGLALWSPYSISKGSSSVSAVIRRQREIRSYSSSDETNFFRGFAIKTHLNPFNFFAFISQNFWDASLDYDADVFTSVSKTGYHRTSAELNRKDRLKNASSGIGLGYRYNDSADISFLYVNTGLSDKLTVSDNISLKNFQVYSGSYNFYSNKISLAGEVSYNNYSWASINNIYFNLARSITCIFSYRNYPSDFHNLYGHGFGETSTTQGETGLYGGVKITTGFGLFNLYVDQFRFPADKKHAFDLTGTEFMIFYTCSILENFIITGKYFNEAKEQMIEYNSNIIVAERILKKFRLGLEFPADDNLRLKSRIELSRCSFEGISNYDKGFLTYFDIKYSIFSNLTIYSRISYFKTNNYNSRIYEFENDLTGVFTNTALFGEGYKWYIMIRLKLSFGLDISCKFWEMYKNHTSAFGSGYDEISGDRLDKFGIQIDFYPFKNR
ncbi:MAG: helix-hairpin-helix domain-containing protein [Melioribacteraceae bacterium]|nr:helix-hairpin-helix domain-containing protein [Melioribacteraceae bacterium]